MTRYELFSFAAYAAATLIQTSALIWWLRRECNQIAVRGLRERAEMAKAARYTKAVGDLCCGKLRELLDKEATLDHLIAECRTVLMFAPEAGETSEITLSDQYAAYPIAKGVPPCQVP